jgi:hypothetical protein
MDIRKSIAAAPVLLALALGCGGKAHYAMPQIYTVDPGQAKVGETVSIGGSSFEGTTAVSIGGAPVPYYKINGGSQIVATVPDDACTGSITVENPAGVRTSSVVFTVVPQITSIDPISGPAGTLVTVTGSGFYGATATAIGGDTTGSSTFTYYDPNTLKVVVGAGAATGPLVVTASGLDATGPTFTVTP